MKNTVFPGLPTRPKKLAVAVAAPRIDQQMQKDFAVIRDAIIEAIVDEVYPPAISHKELIKAIRSGDCTI